MPPAAARFLDLPPAGVPLDELAARANGILGKLGLEVADGRAAERIDGRTVRFYQTIGVLPKPEYEGRRALYSLTHLLRLVAAKRLQAEGHSLAQIQAALPARTDAQLMRAFGDLSALSASVAAVPSNVPSHASTHPTELRAFTLAKGVTLVIDPAVASATSLDPDALAAAIASVLSAPARRRPSGGHR
ncbi:MAG: helix-turn-helix domain-containing protein [Phycisphaerales bacterium]